VSVEQDSNFEVYNDGSTTDKLNYVTFDVPSLGDGLCQLMYAFIDREYTFYRGDDMYTKGLQSIFITMKDAVSKKDLHDAMGHPSDVLVSDSFDTFDMWNLPTPTSGGKLPEQLVAVFKATRPDVTETIWVKFPEHF